MRTQRTTALLVTGLAMVTAVAGAVLTGAGTASAAESYPAPQPTATVNAASVTTGRSVQVVGRDFDATEPVLVRVKYKVAPGVAGFNTPDLGNGGFEFLSNDNGKVRANVPLKIPGTAVITLVGEHSHTQAKVTVRVLGWSGGFWPGFDNDQGFSQSGFGGGFFGGDWPFLRLPYFGGGFALPGSYQQQQTTRLKLAADRTGNAAGAQLLAGGLGLTSLIGIAFVGRRRRA